MQPSDSSSYRIEALELDDGHIYRPKSVVLSEYYRTGATVEVCEVVSQIDGRHHYSVKATAIRDGQPVEAERMR